MKEELKAENKDWMEEIMKTCKFCWSILWADSTGSSQCVALLTSAVFWLGSLKRSKCFSFVLYYERKASLYSDAGGFQLLDEFSNLTIEVEGSRVSFKLCNSPSLAMEIFIALMQWKTLHQTFRVLKFIRKWQFRSSFKEGATVCKDQAVWVVATYMIYLPSPHMHTEWSMSFICCWHEMSRGSFNIASVIRKKN